MQNKFERNSPWLRDYTTTLPNTCSNDIHKKKPTVYVPTKVKIISHFSTEQWKLYSSDESQEVKKLQK